MIPLSEVIRPIIRSIYDGQQDEVSEMSGLSCVGDPGLTKQSAKDECDINKITAKYERTGALPDMIKADPHWGDYSEVLDYQASLDLVLHAQEQFAALDARVRARFNNDPASFLEFATNVENSDEMVRLGLAIPRAQAPGPGDAGTAGGVASPAPGVVAPSSAGGQGSP